jgi:hypothetical protein
MASVMSPQNSRKRQLSLTEAGAQSVGQGGRLSMRRQRGFWDKLQSEDDDVLGKISSVGTGVEVARRPNRMT